MTVRRLLVAVSATILFTVGCASDPTVGNAASSAPTRPTTTAQLRILQPAPNQVVSGTSTPVALDLQNAKVVQLTTTDIKPDEGHIHLSLDGQLVSMSFALSDQLNDLTPGTHTLQAEFVAADHAPFANRVTSVVIFTVQ